MNEYISDEEYSKLFLNDKDIKKIMFITGKINDMFFDIKQLFLKVEMYTLYEGNRVNKVSIFTRDKQHQVGDFIYMMENYMIMNLKRKIKIHMKYIAL